MKIRNNMLIIELTREDALRELELYQSDMISDLAISEIGSNPSPSARASFMLKLLKADEQSPWFEDLVEKYGILWIHTPSTCEGYTTLIELFPHVFSVGQAVDNQADVINGFNHENFEVWFEGIKLNSNTIWNNI